MKQIIRIMILSLLALPFSRLEVRAEEAGPCAADKAKFCGEVMFGGGRIMNCLNEHEQELSTACKDHKLVMIRRFKDAPDECQDDVEQFCREIRPVDRRIIRCLKQNETRLSTECGNIMKNYN